MIVCQCLAVSDSEIKALAKDNPCALREIMRETGAGTSCGGCIASLRRLVSKLRTDELNDAQDPTPPRPIRAG